MGRQNYFWFDPFECKKNILCVKTIQLFCTLFSYKFYCFFWHAIRLRSNDISRVRTVMLQPQTEFELKFNSHYKNITDVTRQMYGRRRYLLKENYIYT